MTSHPARAMGTRHMVASGHYLATQAGFQILEQGGNAIDAGVAAGIALGVVQSEFVNVAGVAPIMIYLAETREVLTISGLGYWPKSASCDYFQRNHGGAIPKGVERSVVPAAPDAWITALERFGTMRFGDVAASAIRFARDGFPMHSLMREIIRRYPDEYSRWPSTAAVYLPNGKPPETGDLFVQHDLGRTLQFLADEEASHSAKGRKAGLQAARDAFYRGDIASTITAFYKQEGGLLAAEDLADFRVAIEPPVSSRFAGFELYACGPWCQGPVLLQALNILNGMDLKAMGHNSPAYIHAMVEALKLAMADRDAYYGDPRFVEVPINRLLSHEYAENRQKLIRPDRAAPGMPEAGTFDISVNHIPAPEVSQGVDSQENADARLDTSYVCVVDDSGNIFSATPSDGSHNVPIVPGTGLSVSGRGSQSWTNPAHPSCIAPGKRPRLTPSPAMAIRDGELFIPFGTPGGDVQAQAMAQVFLNIAEFGMNPQDAIEAPRFATYSFPSSFEPHAYHPGRLNLESRIPASDGDTLRALGHDVEWWPDSTWLAGGVCAISSDRVTGIMSAGADPRRSSSALGW